MNAGTFAVNLYVGDFSVRGGQSNMLGQSGEIDRFVKNDLNRSIGSDLFPFRFRRLRE